MRCINKKLLTVLAAILLITAVASAGVTYSFIRITDNSPSYGPLVADQLFVDIEEVEGNPGQTSFTFRNEGPLNATISEIYFDDGTILASLDEIIEGPNVEFTANDFKKVTPGNLPSGEILDPDFKATASLSSDADPGNFNGVDPGEQVTLIFSLKDGFDYAGVIASLESEPSTQNNMRIGLHVRGIDPGTDRSESYVNNGQVIVPAPGAILLGGIGIAGVGWIKRRRAL